MAGAAFLFSGNSEMAASVGSFSPATKAAGLLHTRLNEACREQTGDSELVNLKSRAKNRRGNKANFFAQQGGFLRNEVDFQHSCKAGAGKVEAICQSLREKIASLGSIIVLLRRATADALG